jgi:uncharacterized protein YjiS (DUF1127 family)
LTDHNKRGYSLQSIITRFIERRREARAVRQLLELPDSMLRDIGLTRWDVQAAVSGFGGGTPSKSLARAASENRLHAANSSFSMVSGEARKLSMAA